MQESSRGSADPREIADVVADALRRGGVEPIAQADLRRARDRVEGLLQLASGAVLVADAAGQVLYASAAVAQLHGYASGAHHAAATPQEIDAGVEVLDEWGRPASPSRLPQLGLSLPTAPEVPLRFRDRGSREERWILLRTAAVRSEGGQVLLLVAFYLDATERRRSEEALRLLSRAGALLGGPHDLTSALDALSRLALPDLADAAVLELEPQAAALGWPHRIALGLGKAPQAIDGGAGGPALSGQIVDPLPAAGAGRFAPLGEQGCSAALLVPVAHGGRTLGALLLGGKPGRRRYGPQDLTLAEDLAARLGAALEGARRLHQAEQAARDHALEETEAVRAQTAEETRRKDEFLAILAHELRNPLAPIVTALGLMRTRESDGKTIARVRALVERQVGQLTRLVDDLLDVSRVGRGKLELRREPVDLLSVVSRAVEASQPLMSRFRHTLSVTLPEDPLFLVADPARIAQVVSNLLNNAAKYTPPGGRVRLLVERDGQQAVIRVRDTGIGIAPEMLARIFEPFVQGGSGPEHARGGLGIGLSLVRALVALHGGEVSVVSSGSSGSGSEFTVRLPALPDAELALPLSPGPLEAALTPRGRRVLVVDDNRDAAEMLAEALQQWGCDVRVASDGPSALALAAERKPDVILLDIGMPGMDGHEVARRLRKDRSLRDVYLIAVTGYGREFDQLQSRESGFDVHLTKPVELEIVQRAIAAAPAPAASGLRPEDGAPQACGEAAPPPTAAHVTT